MTIIENLQKQIESGLDEQGEKLTKKRITELKRALKLEFEKERVETLCVYEKDRNIVHITISVA